MARRTLNTGIDFTGWTLRNSQNSETRTWYGVTGVPPRAAQDKILWGTNPPQRQTAPVEGPLVGQAWEAWLSAWDYWHYSHKLKDGGEMRHSALDLVAKALAAGVGQKTLGEVVIAVPNSLPAEKQDQLLAELRAKGLNNVRLLWRPVALALYALGPEGGVNLKNTKRLVVVDADGPAVEITRLQLDEGIPVRNTWRDDESPQIEGCKPDAVFFRSQLREAANDSLTPQILAKLVEQMETGGSETTIHQFSGLNFDSISIASISESLREDLAFWFEQLAAYLKKEMLFHGDAAVLFHGWPFKYVTPPDEVEGVSVSWSAPPDAVTKGCRMLADGQATYRDTVPGLFIYTEHGDLGLPTFRTLIKRQQVVGGQTVRTAVPVKGFEVKKGSDQLPIVLLQGGDQNWRKSNQLLDEAPEGNVPVKITADMTPGQGRGNVYIQEDGSNSGIFGESGHILLDWAQMNQVSPAIQTSPAYYPVQGRLFDDDGEDRAALEEWLADEQATPKDTVSYRNHEAKFERLLKPWGYRWPWLPPKGKPNPGQPTRGLLGSNWQDGDENIDYLIRRLAKRIDGLSLSEDKIKYLNHLFLYAPTSHLRDIRDKYTRPDPDFRISVGSLPCWSYGYAPGRLFSSADDFKLFTDWLFEHSQEHGYPTYPHANFASKYIWSAFRCLCYFPETIEVGSEVISQLYSIVLNFCTSGDFNQRDDAKHCLCLILFGLRVREIEPDFCQPNNDADSLFMKIDSLLNPSSPLAGVKYPQAMLDQVSIDEVGGLTGFVRRFLRQEATEEDLKALEGLTTSMS